MKHNNLPSDIMMGVDDIIGSDMCEFLHGMLKARYENAVDILNS